MSANDLDIAIIGMACRFPGARTPDEYWENISAGREAVEPLSDDQLRAAGVPDELINDPAYVKVHAPIPDLRAFDAAFFGFSPREASILDPQHRHFLETAWAAFEDAGHVPGTFGGPIGVFAGAGHHHYFPQHLLTKPDLLRSVGHFLLRHTGNDKDFLSTRVSYLLNLRGPSIGVQTACSTSLVAVHLAVQSLLNGECEMAIAGGVTVELPDHTGYKYAEGEILSPDGHCRPFDAASQGTVFGSGVGIVVLRRLKDALADGDVVHAVIRATAINNDGSQKVGYLAPSVEGHAQVAAEAIALAGLEPGSVSYIESHGTGTPVGDPIEIAALSQAYGGPEVAKGSIGIGSVKSNIGHLDTAAGVASLIKVVQSLKHRTLAPTLHYRAPNPACDFPNSPFRVQASRTPWTAKGPLRAGVSSLGVGGTNAHVILEEAPRRPASAAGTPPFILPVSARTPRALERAVTRLADALEREPSANLADVSWTLQVGRQPMKHRLAIAVPDVATAVQRLRDEAQVRQHMRTAASSPGTAFLFAGGGAQYPGMGRGLHESEPAYRAVVDRGLELARTRHGIDLRPLLLEDGAGTSAAAELERPSRSLPALFIVQAATAALWRSWGINPTVLIGHSMGEYTAALEAGILSFEDGLALVARRGELFERVPAGGMVSVAASADAVRAFLDPRLSIAAENAPELCVVSGPEDALEAFERELERRDLDGTRIRIRIAAHSAMLEPILEEWRAFLRTIKLSAPKIPVISNLSGSELTAAEATDPEYWVRQLRQPVRFSDGIAQVLAKGPAALIECGPGRVLTTLARQHPSRTTEHELVLSLRRPDDPVSDRGVALEAAGRVWSAGLAPDWKAIHHGQPRRRVALPTYAFERDEHWVARGALHAVVGPDASTELAKGADLARWGFAPAWKRVPPAPARATPSQVLLLGGDKRMNTELTARLAALGAEVTYVGEGDVLTERAPGHFALDPERPEHFRDLFRELARKQRLPGLVVHAWNVGGNRPLPTADRAAFASIESVGSVLWLAQAIALEQGPEAVRLAVLSTGAAAIGGESLTQPMRAMTAATCRVLNTEADGFSAHAIDIEWEPGKRVAHERMMDALVAELLGTSPASSVALRGSERWEQDFVPEALEPGAGANPLRERGVYLITGGLGGIGLEIADLLTRRVRARLALVSRKGLPPESQWDARLAAGEPDRELARQIVAVRRLRERGAEVLVVRADMADRRAAKRVVAEVTGRFGALHGVFHAAGVLDDSLFGEKTPTSIDRVLRPKVSGALALDEVTAHLALDCFVLFSSTSAFQGLPGQADYAAANAFLDAFARWRADHRAGQSLAINWSVWQEVGMAASLADAQGIAVRSAARGATIRHHVLSQVLVDQPDLVEAAGTLRADRQWVLAEHRFRGGDCVMPGTGYLDLATTVARWRAPDRAVSLEDVSFAVPCVVGDGQEREIRVRLVATAGDAYQFVIRSRPTESAAGWVDHCSGRVTFASPVPVSAEPIAAVRARMHHETRIDRSEPPSSHLDFGARWRNIRTRWLGEAEAVLEQDLGDLHADDLALTALHPALLDMGTAGAQQLLRGFVEEEHFFVPLSYGKLTSHAPLAGHVVSHVTLRAGADAESDVAVYDVTIRDRDDRVLVTVEEFTMFRLRDRSGFRAQEAVAEAGASGASPLVEALRLGIAPSEGTEVLLRALSDRRRVQVIVAPAGLAQLQPRRDLPAAADEAAPEESQERTLELVPPRTPLQTEMVRIASELLGLKRLGINEPLVDRGLHSLLAVRLFNRLQRHTGRNVPLAALLDAPTIELLAPRFGDVPAAADPGKEAAAAPTPAGDVPKGVYDGIEIPDSEAYILPPEVDPEVFSSLVPLKPSGSRTPFFVIHARGGAVLNYQPLTTFVDADQPIYGLQSQGLDGVTEPLRSVEAMAAHYLTEVRRIQPHGPYLLGGGSLGGVIALEMAHQLRRDGEHTAFIAMFDSWGPQVFQVDQRLSAAEHVGSKYQRILSLVRERGLRRTARKSWGRAKYLSNEVASAGLVRWHRFLQRSIRRQLPHEVRYQFVELVNLAALRVYQPRPWDGGMTLFRALDDPDFKPEDPSMGWSGTITGGIRLIDCPGTHNTIMKGPVFGQYLSEELRRAHAAIAEAQRAAGNGTAADHAGRTLTTAG